MAMTAITGVLLLAALAFAILAGRSGSSDKAPQASSGAGSGFDGAALPAGVKAPGFRLTDQHGRSVSLGDLRGQTIVLTFPYSTCGAACVVIAQQIRGALDELSRPVTVLLISADPRADTPANVDRFLASMSLSERVLYLTGSPSQLQAVWRSYRVTPASAGRRAFDRAASVVLIDSQGDERVLFGPEQLTAESLAHDIQKLEGDPAHPRYPSSQVGNLTMMFSTKAEYGVRVMVELARRTSGDPVPLAEIAAHDGLPLAYLEHLVARLRKAELVDSRRGSRGGYMLARPAAQITMAEVVEALEGSIAPIECISEASDGSIVCSRESSPDHICPTKLLWTRVRSSIVTTLRETTLADLLITPAIATAAPGRPLQIEPLTTGA